MNLVLAAFFALSTAASARTESTADLGIFLTALPGQDVPLPAPSDATWRVTGGRMEGDDWVAPERPGTYTLQEVAMLKGRQVVRMQRTAFVTIPANDARGGAVDGYEVGYYPELHGHEIGDAGRLPSGMIVLTRHNRDVHVSPHFTLGQFACKDAPCHKVMFLQPRLVRKLELIVADLDSDGYRCHGLRIMSGYRTPLVNAEIGNTTTLSRHTYGDAADVLVDDWDGDGRITRHDALILFHVIDHIDHTTDLRGGAGIYAPTSAHGWFIHTDARGYIARW